MLGDDLHYQLTEIKKSLYKDVHYIFEENTKVIALESTLSINYFALGMREILNRTLNVKLKNNNIKQQKWFNSYGVNKDDPDRITSKQKYLYIALDIFPMEFIFKLTNLEEKINMICKCSSNLNKYAHFNSGTIMCDYFDRENYKKIILNIFNYFSLVDKDIPSIVNDLKDEIDSYTNEALYNYFLEHNESFDEIDSFGDPKTIIKSVIFETGDTDESFSLSIKITGTLDKIYENENIINDAYTYEGEILIDYKKHDNNYYINNVTIEKLVLNDN